jgi:invasion protein IalB
MLERNNNDYSRFRIFLLENTGNVNMEITDPQSGKYSFSFSLDGFSDAFTGI